MLSVLYMCQVIVGLDGEISYGRHLRDTVHSNNNAKISIDLSGMAWFDCHSSRCKSFVPMRTVNVQTGHVEDIKEQDNRQRPSSSVAPSSSIHSRYNLHLSRCNMHSSRHTHTDADHYSLAFCECTVNHNFATHILRGEYKWNLTGLSSFDNRIYPPQTFQNLIPLSSSWPKQDWSNTHTHTTRPVAWEEVDSVWTVKTWERRRPRLPDR